MNCHESEERLLDYLEGSLSADDRQKFEAHLVQCLDCRTELERWRRVEEQISSGMEAMVVGQSPERSAREIIFSAKALKGKPRQHLRLVAAGIALLVLLSPLFVPFSARVLASAPLVGGYFAKAIAESGLSVAYQAGLVTELNQSATDGGLTLTMLGAYADATQTTVIFTISGDKERMQQWWSDRSAASEQVTLRDGFGREYTGHSSRSGYFDEETGQYHVILETRALPFYVGKLKLGVQMHGSTVNADWKISFPIQRVSDRLVTELKVGQSFTTSDGVSVQIEKLVFSPSRTVLHYSMVRPTTPDHSLPQWSLLADGRELTPLGGGGGGNGNKFSGTAAFFPTNSKDLTIRYEGMMGSYALDWRLEMKPGASAAWQQIVLTIDEVRYENDEVRVWAGMRGGFIKFDPVLQLRDGTTSSGKVIDFVPNTTGDGGVFEMSFPGNPDLAQTTLVIDYGHGLQPDPWSTTIARP